MFIGIFKNNEGKIENYIYFSFEEWHRDTFNPLTEIIGMLDFKIKGKNYMEKRQVWKIWQKNGKGNLQVIIGAMENLQQLEIIFTETAKNTDF